MPRPVPRHAPRMPRRASTALIVVLLAVGSLPVAPAALAGPSLQSSVSSEPTGSRPADVAAANTPGRRASGDPTAATPAVLDTTASGAGQPSIVYEEAMAHANDRIEFTPGGRVVQGFSPRAGDGWPVDGKAPRALPSGRATGLDMARSKQGSEWAPIDTADNPGGSGPTGPAAVDPSSPPASTGDPAAPPPDAVPAPVHAPV